MSETADRQQDLRVVLANLTNGVARIRCAYAALDAGELAGAAAEMKEALQRCESATSTLKISLSLLTDTVQRSPSERN